MSAWLSYSRLNFMKYVLIPRFDPCAMMLPAVPPTIAPRIWPGDRANLVLGRLGRLRGAVTQHHVAHLVRHDAGDFALVMRRFDHPAVEEHRSARQGERVDLFLVDHAERVVELGMLQLGRDGRARGAARCRRRTHRRTHRSAAAALSATCAAASCPSFTSSAGEYLFGGATILVCADAVPSATVSRSTTTAGALPRASGVSRGA